MDEDYHEPSFPDLPEALRFSNYSVELISDIVNDSLRSIYQKDLIGHYVMGVTTLTISCIGFIGNVLSIGVLTSKFLRGTTTNMYLIALAASDALMLLFAILVAVKDARVPQLGVASWELWADMTFFPKYYPFFHAFANLFQVCHA
ncbi:unnamed protein product [Dibothriocephalus latus]|uniref:G-protein coupled receptors family 1 profile domain-containing protein n=1 Tax=Dibothriocephalus latus TaxID=60516 RepID=A0A3P7NWG4_DIBLA|nr:unnamed protein product [Dibothriocephalus latus]